MCKINKEIKDQNLILSYYDVLDNLKTCIKSRFQQHGIEIYKDLETVQFYAAKCKESKAT